MRRGSSILAAVALVLVVPATASAFHGFHSPSGNIGCILSKSGVRCDIAQHDWPTPKKPGWCDVDYGQGLQVGKHGRASFVCAGDTVLHSGGPLAYGESTRRGRFRCRSKVTGMKCVNVRNGHGFNLSREHAKRF
jgi:Family of unknown function (DUF6636)